ncbi:triphosphoribosyl-dephospho-CoA synthase [Antarcticirhabdus aurantiaca]|uniref:Triphosphoribosyl-dephospho-CoA synthase n=1 Tax=Antarcticirhabdus aurantiaca TaxID=2606717 RepID=A0ACD4NJ08_9HYPH|nr:triphosphoribosyl-dephospho-CoA synthase [Antarcticirhabdus aurantiaca]WAJ26789.1 triphosphoribosyl-dephospho-CoA synthase [Jeongeuplla avenae]
MTERRIAEAFVAACRAEIEAPKPGNVHRFAPGHGMTVATFEAAAAAAGPHVAAPGARLGSRILGAVQASLDAVGVNANLGILLLCAPLAMAAEMSPDDLRAGVEPVLAGLDAADAADVFAAIALASPGGLGAAPEADVRAPPAIPLVEAMRLAAHRDLVARQYAEGFADIFGTGLDALAAGPSGPEPWRPATDVFLAFASRYPDSHVARKFGPVAAEAVRERIAALRARIAGKPEREALAALLALDAALKAEGLNPGTSADLTVAALFAHYLGAGRSAHLRNRCADG